MITLEALSYEKLEQQIMSIAFTINARSSFSLALDILRGDSNKRKPSSVYWILCFIYISAITLKAE